MRWYIEHSRGYKWLDGAREGQSHYHTYDSEQNVTIYDHPVDVQFHVASVISAAIKCIMRLLMLLTNLTGRRSSSEVAY